jgi:hypothetical protein
MAGERTLHSNQPGSAGKDEYNPCGLDVENHAVER